LHAKRIQRKNWIGLKDSINGHDDDSLFRTVSIGCIDQSSALVRQSLKTNIVLLCFEYCAVTLPSNSQNDTSALFTIICCCLQADVNRV
jgi:hypothetical protein